MTTSEPLLVDGFTHGGEGVVRLDGKAVFVAGALPGESVRIRVTQSKKNWARGEVVEVVEASPDRVSPPCEYLPQCGGCDLQHTTADAGRRLKTRVVREQLTRLGRLESPPVADCLAVGPDLGYRTHAQFHADDDGRLGFHSAGTHDVVAVDTCLVLTPEAQAVKDGVGDDSGATLVQVRGMTGSGAAAAVLHPGPDALDLPTGPFDLALAQPDGSTVTMRGDGRVVERVAGFEFAFDAAGFFQVNTGGAEAIIEHVLDGLGDVNGLLAWDLYAGVGLLALPMARAGAEVVAVEMDRAAATHLDHNALQAGLDIGVVSQDVLAFVREEHDELPDVIVLDPPRAGAGTDVVTAITALAPGTIVYVACDPASLARDARTLAEQGYRLKSAQPLDLFPMTHHVEIVAVFGA